MNKFLFFFSLYTTLPYNTRSSYKIPRQPLRNPISLSARSHKNESKSKWIFTHKLQNVLKHNLYLFPICAHIDCNKLFRFSLLGPRVNHFDFSSRLDSFKDISSRLRRLSCLIDSKDFNRINSFFSCTEKKIGLRSVSQGTLDFKCQI